MSDTSLQDQIDDATLDFTLGESEAAIAKLSQLEETHPESFGVLHALTEIYFFSEGDYDAALQTGERAPRFVLAIFILTLVFPESGSNGVTKTRQNIMAHRHVC